MPFKLLSNINTSRKLKIWTIITHGLIIVGGGHGILFFFLIELAGFLEMGRLKPVAWSMLLGQLLLVTSMILQLTRYKVITHIAGLLCLWASVIYFECYVANGDNPGVFVYVVLPFAWCTLITFLGKQLKWFYNRVFDKN